MPSLAVPGAELDLDVVEPSRPAALSPQRPWVVQLHGLTSSRHRDALLGLDVARATPDPGPGGAPGARLLRYDARGHGRSSGRPEPADYTWDLLAEDLLLVLEHHVPGRRVHGVGPSMGTGTLLHAAVREPDRFASLTLVVPPTAWDTRRARARTYLDQAGEVERVGVRALTEADGDTPVPPAVAGRPETGPDVAEDLLPSVLRGAARADLPSPQAIATLGLPVLLLAWTDDPSHPLETATALRDLLPHARLEVARDPADVADWPARVREHVARAS